MNGITYSIKTKNNFPKIFAEVNSSGEVIAEYEVNLADDADKVGAELIQQYSNNLESYFDQIVLDMKSEGLTINSFAVRTAEITEVLRIKTQCDQYIDRMDIIE